MPVKKVVEVERVAGAPMAALGPISERMIIRTVELVMYVQDVEAGFDEDCIEDA